MEKVLTVVVPVYNVEKYIHQCLDSFLYDGPLDSLEILVIDDGSRDRSAQIAQVYARKYPQCFRVISKENGGHGSAINTGLFEARGKYFKVVDGDDWVSGDALRNLVSFLTGHSCDLVYTNYCWVKEGSRKKKIDHEIPFRGVTYEKLYSFHEIAPQIFIKMHNMTIRTDILRECRPLTEHYFYVDNEFILYPIPRIQTIAFLPDLLYMYRIGRAEQSVNLKKMQERCGQHEFVLNELLDFYREQRGKMSPAAQEYLARGIARMACSQMKIYLSYPPSADHKKQISALDIRLRREFPEIYSANRNRAVWLLRYSRYSLCFPGSVVLRLLSGT